MTGSSRSSSGAVVVLVVVVGGGIGGRFGRQPETAASSTLQARIEIESLLGSMFATDRSNHHPPVMYCIGVRAGNSVAPPGYTEGSHMGITRIEGIVKESTPVILGRDGDTAILGAVSLQILGLVLNPFNRRLQPMNAARVRR